MSRAVLGFRMLYLSTALLMLFLNLLPLGPVSLVLPAPDLLIGLTLCWTMRRPDYVPLGLVALVFFLADVLLMRPLGLWTLIAILATEYLRRQVQQRETLEIGAELVQVAVVLTLAFLAERVMLTLLLTAPPPLLGHITHLLTTLLFYPPLIVISQMLLGVRRLLPGEVDTLGSRV